MRGFNKLVLKRRLLSKKLSIQIVGFALFCQASAGFAQVQSVTQKTTSAWHDGRFQVDVPESSAGPTSFWIDRILKPFRPCLSATAGSAFLCGRPMGHGATQSK